MLRITQFVFHISILFVCPKYLFFMEKCPARLVFSESRTIACCCWTFFWPGAICDRQKSRRILSRIRGFSGGTVEQCLHWNRMKSTCSRRFFGTNKSYPIFVGCSSSPGEDKGSYCPSIWRWKACRILTSSVPPRNCLKMLEAWYS